MITTVLTVNGMSCEHCVKAVQTALSGLPGVKKASVSLKTKKAEITHDPEKTSLEALKAAVAEAGYEAA